MFERILVGTDGSPTAARAVDRAAALAADFGATLTIATVGDGESAAMIVKNEASRVLGVLPDVHTKVLRGAPADALIAEAGEGYDLLIVGNKGMTGLSRFVAGSVPNKVSHRAPVSLLIVRTT